MTQFTPIYSSDNDRLKAETRGARLSASSIVTLVNIYGFLTSQHSERSQVCLILWSSKHWRLLTSGTHCPTTSVTACLLFATNYKAYTLFTAAYTTRNTHHSALYLVYDTDTTALLKSAFNIILELDHGQNATEITCDIYLQ